MFFILLQTFSFAEESSIQIENDSEKSNSYNVISLNVENDIYFSDRYYTNGIQFGYTETGDNWWASYLQFKFLRLFIDDRTSFQTANFGQLMNVSSEINDRDPSLTDRPYAGVLYLGATAHLANETRSDSFGIYLGVVGPLSLAGDTQKFIHELLGSTRPMGWHTQIRNEPGFVLSYNHSERLADFDTDSGFGGDIIASAGCDLGNIMSQAKARMLFRAGFNMPKSFDTARIDYGSNQDVAFLNPSSWHCYFYAGVTGRAVGYDITLDGNTWKNSRSVDKDYFIGEANVGISTRIECVQFDLTWNMRSREFKTQEYKPHSFWSFTAKVFF